MRRHVSTPWFTVLVAVLSGVAWFAWEAHNLGPSCGYSGGIGLPNFPITTALIVLVGVPVFLTAVRSAADQRSVRATVGFMALAAVLAGATTGIAEVAFVSTRHCFA